MTYEPWFEDGRTGTFTVPELRHAAAGMLRARQAMRGVMPEPLLSDLPLEIMLALFIAYPEGCDTDALGTDTGAPGAMVGRWLGVLEAEKLIVTAAAPTLSAYGLDQMTEMMTRVIRSQRSFYGWQQ